LVKKSAIDLAMLPIKKPRYKNVAFLICIDKISQCRLTCQKLAFNKL